MFSKHGLGGANRDNWQPSTHLPSHYGSTFCDQILTGIWNCMTKLLTEKYVQTRERVIYASAYCIKVEYKWAPSSTQNTNNTPQHPHLEYNSQKQGTDRKKKGKQNRPTFPHPVMQRGRRHTTQWHRHRNNWGKRNNKNSNDTIFNTIREITPVTI